MNQLTDSMKQGNGRFLYRTAVWLCCLMAVGGWGCTVADVREEPVVPAGERLQVEIPVAEIPLRKMAPIDTKAVPDTTAQPSVLPVTRAGEVVYKRAIVLQYSADGNTLLNAGTTDIDNYTIGSSISARLVSATGCKIYVWTVNETATTGTGTAFDSEAKLLAATYDLYAKFPSPTDTDIPLIGSISGINVVRMASGSGQLGVIQDPSEANSKVMLSRIAAKLDIRFFYNLPGFRIGNPPTVPATATLANIPQTFYVLEQSGTVFPAENSAAAFGTVSVPLTSYDGDKTDESATEYVRYIPANRRGTNSAIAYPKDKWSGTAPRTTIDRCTYLTFTATNKTTPAHKLVYSFYFGGNNTTDFNILRNHTYIMNSTILQRSEGDNRITEAGLSPVVATEPTAESVGSNTASIKGTVTDKRGAAITSYGFYYKAGTPFSDPANPAKDGTKAGEKNADIAQGTPFGHTLTGLAVNTAYYFTAYATSANGTSYGVPNLFTTNAAGLPVLGVQNQLVSAADGRSASSSGNTITSGIPLLSGIVWSAKQGFDFLTSGTRVNGTPVAGSPYAVTVSGLTPGATYYYRYLTSSAAGFVYGNAEQSVRLFDILTLSNAAAVTSTVVDKLRFAATTAKKNAADPSPTASGVKLWTTNPGANPGSVTAATTVSYDSPTAVGAKTADWTGMTAGQTYWYVSYATNTVGSTYSAVQSFTASQALTPGTPSVTTLGPQAVAGITLATTSRNTKAVASNGATVTAGDNTASKTISIADYTTATTSRTPTIALTTIGELPLRTATATITQYGVAFPASFSNVTNVVKAGQSATNVSVTANIPWKATSNQSWCTIASGTQTGANTQTGSALNFTYTVAKNTGAARSATITVAGTGSWTGFSRTFTVGQLPGGQINITPDDPNNDNSNVDFKK